VIPVPLKVRHFGKGKGLGTTWGRSRLLLVITEVSIEAWRRLQLFYVGMDDRMTEQVQVQIILWRFKVKRLWWNQERRLTSS